MENTASVEIHVRVPDEDGAISTQAIPIGNGHYKILARPDYNAAVEDWEFAPGSIVRCEWVKKGWPEPLLLAMEKVDP